MSKKIINLLLLGCMISGMALFGACFGGKGGLENETYELPSVSYVIQTKPDAAEGNRTISDTLYGIFLEDINFAIDGGMYVEMLKNRSFEYGAVAGNKNRHGWVASGSADSFSFEVVDGSGDASCLNPNNPNYAVLTNTSTEYAGIFNKGFLEGLSVKANEEYIFSGYFRTPENYNGDLRITIGDSGGSILAQGLIKGITQGWQKYSISLTPDASSGAVKEARLYVEMTEGVIYADMLSLMPVETYKGTFIRKDIGEYLEALNPSFLRFPGGCVAEGRDIESIYSWKDSIGNGMEFGDAAVRPQGKSIWNGTGGHPYYTTYGIGFYEFFELCDILGCMPVPVLNAGMTCQVQSPKYIVFDINSEEFAQCIQDALDLVEFCKGGGDTYWGSVRIAMGHKEPFALKYIGIGNEQWQSEYFQHYKKFTDAFENAAKENPALYGDIELIIANGPSSGDTVGSKYLENNPDNVTGLVDEHYYESPNWFLTNTERYDKYGRDTQAKVFLGEYAAQSNTLEAALAEAAYMTGLERNSDIVKMACYAPLFGNLVANQWKPDLIWFSQDTVFGSVNYYVQKMFANNVGTALLKSTLDIGGLKNETVLSGKVGLATWQTSAAFDNLKVVSNKTGETLYKCTFDDESVLRNDGWDENEGDWYIKDGRLIQGNIGDPRDGNTGDSIYVGDTAWTDYTMTVDAEVLNGKEGFLIPVCVENTANNIFWNLGGWGNTVSCLQIVSANAKSGQINGTVRNVKLKRNQVYGLRVEVSGSNIKCYIDGILYVDYTYEESAPLYETASEDKNSDIIIKLVNVSNMDINVDVTLKDIVISDYEAKAAVTILKGSSPSDVNSFNEPEKLIPVQGSCDITEAFTYTAKAYSINIIRVKKK